MYVIKVFDRLAGTRLNVGLMAIQKDVESIDFSSIPPFGCWHLSDLLVWSESAITPTRLLFKTQPQ